MMRSTRSISDSHGRRTTKCWPWHGVRSESSLPPTSTTHRRRLDGAAQFGWTSRMEKLLAGLPPRPAPPVERSPEPRQLDLFLDGRDAFLVHEVLTSLVGRDLGRAETGLERLREGHPFPPDLPALALLVSALNSPPPSPTTLASVTAGIEALQQAVAPTAQRVLGEDAAAFLQPSWQGRAARGGGPPARASRHLLSLVPLESQGLSDVLVHRRRALQQLSPGFFRYYLDVVGRRGSRV